MDYIFLNKKVRVHNMKRIVKYTHPFPCQYFNTFKMQNFTPESFRPGVFHSFGIRTTDNQRRNTQPKIHPNSQIFRYSQKISCLPHRPNFSDTFDLCLHWVSVVRGLDRKHMRVPYENRMPYNGILVLEKSFLL